MTKSSSKTEQTLQQAEYKDEEKWTYIGLRINVMFYKEDKFSFINFKDKEI